MPVGVRYSDYNRIVIVMCECIDDSMGPTMNATHIARLLCLLVPAQVEMDPTNFLKMSKQMTAYGSISHLTYYIKPL